MEQDIAAQVVGLGGSSDFSLWSLFLRADFVVKFVIILLIASSIFSWALIFDKFKLFKSINKSTEDFEKKFWKAKSAESFNSNLPVSTKDPATLIFKAAMAELLKTKRQSSAVQTARVERILEIATDNEVKKVEKNFTFLATIGSTAPFIGLFGTVWGIMNSFQSIAISRNTSLAIVAPECRGVICYCFRIISCNSAVVAYNKFNSDSRRYFSKIDNFSKDFYQ